MPESQFNYLFTLKNAHLSSNSYNFRMQPNIPMKFAGYVALILMCKLCKFGEKIYYNSGDIEFFLGDYFFLARPVYIYIYTRYALIQVDTTHTQNDTENATLRHRKFSLLDPEGGFQKATLVVLVLGISSLKIAKAFLIRSEVQRNFAYTFVLTFPTDLPSQIFKLTSN